MGRYAGLQQAAAAKRSSRVPDLRSDRPRRVPGRSGSPDV